MASKRSLSASTKSIDEMRRRSSSGTWRKIFFTSAPSLGFARKIAAVAGDVDAGQHHFARAMLDEKAHLIDDGAHRHGARIAASVWDDAERAAVIAPILHLHESACVAAQSIHQMQGGLLHGHDIVDENFLAFADAEIPAVSAAKVSAFIFSSLPMTCETSRMAA